MNHDRALAAARDTLLIGVDGGASGFRAHEVRICESGGRLHWSLGEHSASENIEPVEGFSPKALEVQREEVRRGALEFSREELRMQARWVHAASRAIWQVSAACGRDRISVGICAPGLKTPDGRGIELALNGPRIPDFADDLEQSLVIGGLNVAQQIGRVVSDGLACGHGEELAEDGLFRSVRDAYYIGGGSGVAEAFKLAGKVQGLEQLAPTISRAWQLRAADGASYEEHLSIGPLNRAFGLKRIAVVSPEELPETAAARGDPRAVALFDAMARSLAEFCCARILELHTTHGTLLERIVIGQRLGQFFRDPRLEPIFAARARSVLLEQLRQRAAPEIFAAWIDGDELRAGRLMGSSLRAASALGALALAIAPPQS